MILALESEHVTIWWVTLGMGAVVAAVVVALLSLLVGLVRDIDENVKETWDTATRVARNTATTWMLRNTTRLTGELRAETGRHAGLLGARGGAR
jgi:hypothetical protein